MNGSTGDAGPTIPTPTEKEFHVFRRMLPILALAGAVLVPSPALAATWETDVVHSSVTFKVRHFFTKVTGRFNEFKATIDFDPKSPSTASVTAAIQAASINTDNENRDKHLRSADFFDVEKYPEIAFKSTKVEAIGENLKVTGDFTMHGVTKPVTLDVQYLGAMEVPGQGWKAGFTATGTINRKDFGITWNNVLDSGGTVLGDEVEIQIDIEAKRASGV
jgi:polyisoprenoid-binding protein YceI